MTRRLYYTDPYLREFDAVVERVERCGERTCITLDRTAFYPTSGGQPFDTGTLDALRVVDVADAADGSIVHVVETEAAASAGLAAGRHVHGTIDWTRRFDHMQQHTGQHVLSAAFDRIFAARTASFHLGATSSTIDLEQELGAPDVAAAEAEANRIVWENRPIAVRFVSQEEASALTLRKPPPLRSGDLRLVEIDRFDRSACGGTHVARTGGVGIIAVLSGERFKGGQRIEFACGGRALGRFRALRDAVASAARALSVGVEDLPAAVARLQADGREQKRAVTALQADLARYRGRELAAAAEPTGRGPMVFQAADADAGTLRALAASVAASGCLAVLVSTGPPALVAVAAPPGHQVAANAVVGALTARFGGRGGGSGDLAQAGGLSARADDILQAARAAVLD